MTTRPGTSAAATGGLARIGDVDYYRIDGVEHMPPFLMAVASDADLWMFVSSTGALTAGRRDADHALLPYETDDRLHHAVGHSGPVTVIARTVDGRQQIWRPFDIRCPSACTRAVAKSVLGNRVVFEERHRDWGLVFRTTWAPSRAYGWSRTSELVDAGGGGATVEVLDGLLDVVPAGVDAAFAMIRSNLVNAYKRSETGPWGTAALYTLESLPTDRAEPAEALAATLVWSAGLPSADVLLDERSVDAMVRGRTPEPEALLTGRRGAYLLRGRLDVPAGGSSSWRIVADTGLDHAEVRDRIRFASDPEADARVARDVDAGTKHLRGLLAGADAFQDTGDPVADAHHLSNVLFNSMRGGVFPYGYRVPVADLRGFLRTRNRGTHARYADTLDRWGTWIDLERLHAEVDAVADPDLTRLVLGYLPLTFARRHGDPSRPWNRFSIRVRTDDGDELLSYEGNWRDIFQNWEALLQSYPRYLPHVVATFVNASTVDGHNPYRISRDGIDWEVPDPDDPWSNIGYWGDHQIVYLLRLLESWQRHDPGGLGAWLDRRVFTYADVPYVIADHASLVRDPRDTITFDQARADAVDERVDRLGADGRLTVDATGELVRVGLFEKLLVPALAKLSSYVPHGGIWMNTQRPEWNDANNALAGYGLSMVTLYHLERYLRFVRGLAEDATAVEVSRPVAQWLAAVRRVLEEHADAAGAAGDDRTRRRILDGLGLAGQAYREQVYAAFDPTPVEVPAADVMAWCDVALAHLHGSIAAARRDDGLFHSYNLVSFPSGDQARVRHLEPMLEGQVAALSSGTLSADTVLEVVDALYASDLYREDQRSFMLYPATPRPSFLERNTVPASAVQDHPFLRSLVGTGSEGILCEDADGDLHFGPGMVNAQALADALDAAPLDAAQRKTVLQVYEDVFDHHTFTGRSGAMYAYEGLGSIYWHMVAKLLLAVQEAHAAEVAGGGAPDTVAALAEAYRRIRGGLGYRKDPETYGAIPTDCYSHTPAHAGAQQPGMTGQVKEEILTRPAEFGLRVEDGRLVLGPPLLPPAELVGSADAASCTLCGVPVRIRPGATDAVTVVHADGTVAEQSGPALTNAQSDELFDRSERIERIEFVTTRYSG